MKILLSLITLIVAITSCSKSSINNKPLPDYYIYADIDGVPTLYDTSANFSFNEPYPPVHQGVIMQAAKAPNIHADNINISISSTYPENLIPEGSYVDTPNAQNYYAYVVYDSSFKVYQSLSSKPNATTVNITLINDSLIQGTFNSKVIFFNPSGDSTIHYLTNGKFRLKFEN